MKNYILSTLALFLLIPAFGQTNWTVKDPHPQVFAENKGQFAQDVLFTAKISHTNFHFTKDGYRAEYLKPLTAEEKKMRHRKVRKGESVPAYEINSWEVKFANASIETEILPVGEQAFTFNYNAGDELGTVICKTYSSIMYRDIYPNIDIVIFMKDNDGFKYNFNIRPGANPDDIEMLYPLNSHLSLDGDVLYMKNEEFVFKETIPASYYSPSNQPAVVKYKIDGQSVKFTVEDYNPSEVFVIDPWTVTISPFTTDLDFYKCDWDNAGNVYALGEKGFEVAKYDDTGALIWVYIEGVSGGIAFHSDFVTRHVDEELIYVPPFSTTVKKLSPAGVEILAYTSTAGSANEIWRCEYDEFNDQVILGKGGAFFGGFYLGALSSDFASETEVEVLPPGGSTVEDVIWMEIDPSDTIIYAMAAGTAATGYTIYSGYGNSIVTSQLPLFTTPTIIDVWGPHSEVQNGNYADYGGILNEPNVFQGIAVNGSYIFTYDGINLKSYDKATETIVDSLILATTDTMSQSGIACDLCGNVYIGVDDSVLVFNGPTLIPNGGYATDSTVLDVRINGGLMYVCGENFLSEFDISAASADLVMSSAPTTCGACNGTATADTAGCPGYTFDGLVWSPGGETDLTITGLCDGWYVATGTWISAGGDTITIVDSSLVSTGGATIDVTEAFTDVACPGACDGTITLTPTTGSPPYTYDIGTATNTTGEFEDLCEGTYTITVTDAFGCDYTGSITISAGAGLNLNIQAMNEPSCFGFTDGSITMETLNGDPPFDYVWDPPNSVPGSAANNNIGAMTYTVTVTDANGCTGSMTITLDEPDSMIIDLDLTHVLCHGDPTGYAILDTITGWQGDYSNIAFNWSSGPPGGAGEISDTLLEAGIYTVSITDDMGCQQELTFEITEPPILEFAEIGYEPAYCRVFDYQVGNGQVFASATGGTPDYTYLWTNLQTLETHIPSTWGALNPGDYEIVVTDANGCILTQIVTMDSVNPQAVLDISSAELGTNLEGTAVVCVEFMDTNSLYFANPLNPLADTTFWLSMDYPDHEYVLIQGHEEFYAVYDTCYTEGGEYLVCLKTQNKNGCEDSVCHTITVYDPLELTPPNVFTPNGDGVNDVFTFEFLQKGIETFECVIVNRWGVVIAEIDDVYKGWDGTDRNGSESRDGVYFYVYKGVAFNGEEFDGQGTVQLVRGD